MFATCAPQSARLSAMDRVDVVFNPSSGRGRSPAIAKSVAARLGASEHDVRLKTIGEYLGNPIEPGARCVVTIGGDGTVRAIVEGLCATFGEHAPPVAVIALGTANLVARHLHLPWSADEGHATLAHAIATHHTRGVDVAVANGQPFLLMCSVGFDARVVHELATHRSGPIHILHYVPAFARSWIGFSPHEVEVIADGRHLFGPAPAMVVVANAAEYGTGFSMNPHARTDDGLLDVSVFTMADRKHLVTTAFHAATRRIGHAAAILATARNVEIRGAADVHAQVDGEPFGHPPIRIGLLPHRQRFIVAPD